MKVLLKSETNLVRTQKIKYFLKEKAPVPGAFFCSKNFSLYENNIWKY